MHDNLYLVLLIIVYLIFRVYFDSHRFSEIKTHIRNLFGANIKSNASILRENLENSNSYFRNLSEKGKLLMMTKSFSFLKSKKFIGMQGLEVTDEMIATISGTAAQLTFGLKKSAFSYYHTIKIFPESFYSRLLDHEIKGGASTSGVLFFSWKDFKEGYADYEDKYNLGLHEMAHALRMELKYGNDFDSRFADYIDRWMDVAMPEFEKMNKGNTSFLRDYAGTNVEEFFAVCVEHFFEVPIEFKQQLPDIYNHLCFLLNQDPSNVEEDNKLSADFASIINANKSRKPIPSKIKRNYNYDAWHWSSNFIVIGLFLATPLLLVYLPEILINISTVVLCIAVLAILTTQFRTFFYSKGIFLYYHLVMFAVIGVGLPVVATGVVINRKLTSKPESNSYKIVGYSGKKSGSRIISITYELENNDLSDFKNVRTVNAAHFIEELTEADRFLIVSTTGLLGFSNIEKRALIIGNDTIEVPAGKY